MSDVLPRPIIQTFFSHAYACSEAHLEVEVFDGCKRTSRPERVQWTCLAREAGVRLWKDECQPFTIELSIYGSCKPVDLLRATSNSSTARPPDIKGKNQGEMSGCWLG